MARRRGLTQEEIVKLMQEQSDRDSSFEIDNSTNKEDKEGNETSSRSEFGRLFMRYHPPDQL